MTQYIAVEADTKRVLYGVGPPDPAGYSGPAGWRPMPHDGIIYYPWQGQLLLSGAPSPTSMLEWQGEPVWIEMASLESVITQTLDQIDTAADVARTAVLIKTTKAEEYMQAETQARAWKESGYAGAAPPDVASWAAAKWREQMTEQQAAESILAQADQYRNLLSGIRALRLKHMEDARHAADAAGVRTCLAAFTVELSNLMKGPTE